LEALYLGFDAQIKSYYFRLAGAERQCMERQSHMEKKKKTTKAWHFISRINYTLLAMGQKFQGLLNDFLAST